jgi:hypothetical protein
MTGQQLSSVQVTEQVIIALARELAMDLNPVDDVLDVLNLSRSQLEKIKETDVFKRHFEEQVLIWSSSDNAAERVKLKSTILLEEWLPTLNTELSSEHPLASKVKGGELLMRLAGLNNGPLDASLAGSEKFSITINMGDGAPRKIETNLPTQVIEGSAEEVSE